MNRRVVLWILFCSLLASPLQARQMTDPWLVIDTRQQVLQVMHGGRVAQVFDGIALGRGGVADLRFQGDGRTPRGEFRIGWVNRASRFHLFFGLDYPNRDHAERAYRAARIDPHTYGRITAALMSGRTPPQDTPLGGYIGIHGLGSEDPRTHRMLNWTQGCIALTNEQIEQLARWVDVGTRVVIL